MDVLIKPFDKDYFSVSFLGNFNEVLLHAVHNVSRRRWNKKEKLWLLPDNKLTKDKLIVNLYETGLFTYRKDEKEASYLKAEIRKLIETMTVRHYSDHTKACYKKWVEEFLLIHQKNINTVGKERATSCSIQSGRS